MKTLRTLIALAFATALAGSVAFADDHGKKSEAKPGKAPCGCVVKKDGKVCGVDSDCCCTGEKAKGQARDKADKKTGDKKGYDKKSDAKACCTDAACVPAEKGKKADKGDKAAGKAADCTACTTCK